MATIKKGAYRFNDELTIPSWLSGELSIPINYTTRRLFDYDGTTLVPDDTSSDLNRITVYLQDGVLKVKESYIESGGGASSEFVCYEGGGVGWNVQASMHETAGYTNFVLAKGFGQIINVTEDIVVDDENVAAWFTENTRQKMFVRLDVDEMVFDDDDPYDNKRWVRLIEDGVFAVTKDNRAMIGYNASTRNLTIPETVLGQEGRLQKVVYISAAAFNGCANLTSVVIGDSVINIGKSAFNGCANLTSVVIGDSVINIGRWAFRDCDNLTSVVIGDSVAAISYSAFEDCTSLTSVVIPDSVTFFDYGAFIRCFNLANVYYTGTIEQWCNISFDSNSSNPMNSGANLYIGGELVTKVVIPDTFTKIKTAVFSGCTSLTSVVIPDSVTSIGSYAFYGCTSLTSIKYRGTEAQWNAITKGTLWVSGTGNYTITYNYTGD